MKLNVYCEVCTRNDTNGEVEDTFGLKLSLGETERDVSYEEFTGMLDRAGILDLCCLSEIVAPEDLRFITEAEYNAEYGDDDESAVCS